MNEITYLLALTNGVFLGVFVFVIVEKTINNKKELKNLEKYQELNKSFAAKVLDIDQKLQKHELLLKK